MGYRLCRRPLFIRPRVHVSSDLHSRSKTIYEKVKRLSQRETTANFICCPKGLGFVYMADVSQSDTILITCSVVLYDFWGPKGIQKGSRASPGGPGRPPGDPMGPHGSPWTPKGTPKAKRSRARVSLPPPWAPRGVFLRGGKSRRETLGRPLRAPRLHLA